MKKIILVIYIFFSIVPQTFSQTTGWWIFRRVQSTKPKPVTAVAAVRGDLSGVFYNPSILGTISEKEIFFLSEIVGIGNDTFGGVLYGQPVGKFVGLSAGVVYYDAGKTTLYWIEKGEEQNKSVTIQRDILSLISGGKKIATNLFAGISLKIANSTIVETKTSWAVASDIGFLYFPIQNLSLSAAIQNIGITTKFVEKEEPLPTSIWFGSCYRLDIGKTSFAIGVDFPYILSEQKFVPTIGVELGIKFFAINAGYRFNVKDANFQIGFTTKLKNFDFGYSFVPSIYLSQTHRINLGLRW
jgi:hypothetical protein